MKNTKHCFISGIIFLLISAVYFQSCDTVKAAAVPRTIDTQAPTVPARLTAGNKTYTSVSLTWTASTDNISVKGYEVYRDGKRIGTTSKTCYTNMNLVPGTNYTYSIKAYDASGNISGNCSAIHVTTNPDTQAPSNPQCLTADAPTYTSIALSWGASSDNTGIKGYEIYCNGKKAATTSSTSYTCKRLLPGSTYIFTVRAFDIAGNYSVDNNTCSADTMPDAAPPSIPDGLKAASVSCTEIGLTWTPSSDNVKVMRYEVLCDGKSIGTTSKTSYHVRGLIPGASSTYTVRALDSTGNISKSSAQLRIKTVDDLRPPKAPTGFNASASSSSSVSLKWKTATDDIKIKGYHVYCNGIKVATTTRTSYTVKGLRNLGIGVFYVKAYDLADNLSESSNTDVVILLK